MILSKVCAQWDGNYISHYYKFTWSECETITRTRTLKGGGFGLTATPSQWHQKNMGADFIWVFCSIGDTHNCYRKWMMGAGCNQVWDCNILITETQTYWESGYEFCSKSNFDNCGGLVLRAKKLDPLHIFDLEQLVYLVEQHNRCTTVAVGEITKRPILENFHNIPIVKGFGSWRRKSHQVQAPMTITYSNHCIMHAIQCENGPPPNELPFFARFEDHIAFVVGGRPARNGTLPYAWGEEGNQQNLMRDPLIDSTTHTSQESTYEPSNVFATITTSRNGVTIIHLYLHATWAGMTWQHHQPVKHNRINNNIAWWNTLLARWWYGNFHLNG